MAQDEFWKSGGTLVEDSTGGEWWKTGGTPVEEEPPARGFKGWAQDIGATALKGAIGVPEALVGLADIPTGGRVGKFLENEGGTLGFRPKQAKEAVNEWHSDATKAAQQKFQEAEGFGGKFKAAIENPSVVASAIGESIPSMAAGGVAARGLMAATRLGQMGAGGAALAGAAGEGAMMAGSQAANIRQETEDGLLTPTQAGLAAATGVVGGALGAVGGKVAQRLGVGDVDTMIAQGATGSQAQQAALKSIPKQVIQGAMAEGLLEELPQSVSEQILQNMALGKDWSEGVDAAAVMGVLSGGAMGGAAAGVQGFANSRRPAEQAPQELSIAPDNEPVKPSVPEGDVLPEVPGGAASVQRTFDPRAGVRPPLGVMPAEAAGNGIDFQASPEFDRRFKEFPPLKENEPTRSLGFNPLAGTPTIYPDGSVALNGEQEFQYRTGSVAPQKRSEQMGLNPSAGPMSAAAATAVDTGAADQVQQQAALAQAAEAAAKAPKGKVAAATAAKPAKRVAHRVTGTLNGKPIATMVMASTKEEAIAAATQSAPGMVPATAEPVSESVRKERAAKPETPTAIPGETALEPQATEPVQASAQEPQAQPAAKGLNNKQAAQPAAATPEAAADPAPTVRGTGVSGGDQPKPLDALSNVQDQPQGSNVGGAAAKPVSREQAIRDAWRKEPRTIGKWTPISVEAEGQKADMLVNQKRAGGDKDGALHVVNIRMGKMLKDMEREPIAYTFRLTADNRLVEEGIPTVATPGQIAAWKGAGFALDDKQTNVQNTPQGTAGEAKAPSVKESKAEGGNAASNAGVPDTRAGEGVRKDGVGKKQVFNIGGRDPHTATFEHKDDGRLIRTITYPDGQASTETLVTNRNGDESWVSQSSYEKGEFYPVQLSEAEAGTAIRDDIAGKPVKPAAPGAGDVQADGVKAAAIVEAAHQAATSPKNDLPQPTEAQKDAGNYVKGHVTINGLGISIENPAGSKRRPEWPALKNHYGYFKGSVGADKDHVDVFMTDRAGDESLPVFVVDQVNKDGTFDEHKVVMGAADEAEARSTYLQNYEKGWTGLGAITQMSLDDFKAWVRDPAKTKKPVALKRGVIAKMAEQKAKKRAAMGPAMRAALESVGLDPDAPVDKAAKLRRDANKLAEEARKMLDGIVPGQPVMSVRDRNLRDRSGEKMRKAGEMLAEADRLDAEKAAQSHPKPEAQAEPSKDAGSVSQAPAAQAEPEQNKLADYDALAKEYGYEVRPDGSIGSDGKFPGVTMSVKKGRLRIEGKNGNLLGRYAPTPESLGKFLEAFWYAEKKKPAAQAEKPAEPVKPTQPAQPKEDKPAEDEAFMGVEDKPAKSRKGKITAEQYEANLSAWANGAPKVMSDKADDYAFKSGQSVLLEAFHGTGRGDRVGTKFLKKRATSGPMSFFTSSAELAAGYATGKQDTSLYNEDTNYANWFKYQPKGQRSPLPLDRAWHSMDAETKRKIIERMPDIRTDDDGNIIYEQGGGDIGSYQWNLKQTQRGYDKQGNPLAAAIETWLMSGSLFGEEQDFMKVLKLAGVPVSDITYDNPGETFPFVYKTWVRMSSPLVTSDIPVRVQQALKAAALKDKSRAQSAGADTWDKNTRTLRDWVKEYFEPATGDNKFVWTSIPDKVTEVFKAEGYDGIIDWSGKGGGATHPVYIPFEQNQVKSAIGNSGKFDPEKDDIMAFGEADAPIFYSALRKEIEGLSTKSAPAVGWNMALQGLVKNGKVKADELEWTGISEWLKLQTGKVSKEDVLAYLDANGVQVTETVLRSTRSEAEGMNIPEMTREELGEAYREMVGYNPIEDDPSITTEELRNDVRELYAEPEAAETGETKYSNYTLPGGTNYREVLLTLPIRSRNRLSGAALEEEKYVRQLKEKYGQDVLDSEESSSRMTDEEANKLFILSQATHAEFEAGDGYLGSSEIQTYESSHWDQKNVLAHIRVNDRVDADGKRVLFVEELQSDWGQDGKKRGFADRTEKKYTATRKGNWYPGDDSMGKFEVFVDGRSVGFFKANSADYAIAEAQGSSRDMSNRVPSAPFVDKTDKWLALSLKRIMKMAVDGGYDRVAFVNGEQSAERYSLDKQISKVEWITRPVSKKGTNSTPPTDGTLRAWDKNGQSVIDQQMEAADLGDNIGKELAQKLIDTKPSRQTGAGKDVRELAGIDLKVPAKGMRDFYDKIVPAAVKDVLKKVGGGQMEAVKFGGITKENLDRIARLDYDSDYDSLGDRAQRSVMAVAAEQVQITPQPGFTITDSMREKVAGGLPLFAGSKSKSRGAGTPIDRAVMSMASDGKSGNDILQFIANASRSPYRRQLAKKLLATKANPTVTIGGEMGSKDGYKNLAFYSRKNHEIVMSEDAVYKAEQIFLHEATHSATLLALDKQTLFGVQMKKLYESVQAQGLSDTYGMKNIGEFVAEAFTNPQFQKALRDYKAPQKEAADMNLWERFVAIVRKILRMEPKEQDALSAALDLGAKVMRENMPLRAARSFRAEDGPAFAGDNGGMLQPKSTSPAVTKLNKVMRGAGWEIEYIDLDMTGEKPKVAIRVNRDDGRFLIAKVDSIGRASFETFQRERSLRMDGSTKGRRPLSPMIDDTFLGRQKFEGARSMLRGMVNYLVDNASNPVALSDMKSAWAGAMAAPVQQDVKAIEAAPGSDTAFAGSMNSMPAFDNASGDFNPDLDKFWLKKGREEINGERMSDADYNTAVAEYANAWRINDLLVDQLGWRRRGSSNLSASTYYEKTIELDEPNEDGQDTLTYEVRVTDHDDYHPAGGDISKRFQVNFRSDQSQWSDVDITPDMSTKEALSLLRGTLETDQSAPDTDGAMMGIDQTETPEFKRWFAGSKVVDSAGKPLVVYHGTASTDITEFLPRDEGNGPNTVRSQKLVEWFRKQKASNARIGYMNFRAGSFFSPDPNYAGNYTGAEGGVMYPAYIKAENPVYIDQRTGKVSGVDPSKTIDALIMRDGNKINEVAVLDPTQIKSAIGNRGTFDPNDPDIAHFGIADAVEQIGKQAAVKPVVQALNDTFKVRGKLHWWHKTVGTPFNLAERVPEFKRVFNAVQDFINSVSFYGAEAAAMAPKIIPKLESWKDLGKSPIKAEDNKAIAAPIFEGTLAWMRGESGKPVKVADMQAAADKLSADEKAQRLLRARKISPEVLAMWRGLPLEQFQSNIETRYTSEMLRPGVVWSDSELRSLFKLNDEQIGLYREFRAATDKSLTDLAMSDILQFAGKDADPIKDQVMGMNLTEGSETVRDYLLSLADSDPDRRSDLIDTANTVIDKANRVQDLMDSGYAPLQRFGRFTVYAKDADGEQLFFGMYEDRWAAARAARQMREQYPDASIETGMMSQEAYKLFQGISPETLEIFGTMLGMDSQADGETNKAFQTYLKLAKSNRSALKRLIERKGISGYSEDASRVLASFIYSNARQTASNLHVGEIMNGVNDIPRDMGDAKDAAMRLARYTMDPQEEAQAIRGLLFAQYLGGSIASAAINALQPAQVTFPYLSQFVGAKKSAVLMKDAVRDALKQKTGDARLDAELKKAEEEGIVSPQEIFQLMAQAQGKATLRAGDGSAAGNAAALASNTLSRVSLGWGKVFSIPEQFNRRTTFIAAYRTALETGEANPYDFAKQAVKETQLVYNKGNRPEWARGAIGALAFTFKTYSISYVELLQRMAASGPEGRRAAMLMLGVLFLMAGAGGAPGVEDLEDVVDGIAQRVFGLNFQSRQKRQEWLAETFGEGAARFIENGVSGLPWSPTDVSGRLGLGNLIPGTGLFVKKENYGRDVAEIAGPAADMTKRFLEGAGLLLQGEVLKAGEIVSPVAVRNMIQGGRMLATDQYTDTKGRKVIDTTTAEGITKLIGFQPADVARVQEATGTTQRMIVLNKIRESEIADKWAKGLASGDADLVQEARDDLARWNKANPESQIRIKIPQIMRRVRALKEDKATRIARTAPAEIRQDVRRALEQGQ